MGKSADRLKCLLEAGLLTGRDDPTHKQEVICSLAEPAIALVPLLTRMGEWDCRHTPVTEELSIRARLLFDGGLQLWDAFMRELLAVHLGGPQLRRSVLAELQRAYLATVAKRNNGARRS